MKSKATIRLVLLVAVSFLFIMGCASNRTSLTPVNGCKPLSSFSAVNLAPFDTSTTIVTNVISKDSMVSSLTGYVHEINDQLKSKLEATRRFNKISNGSECGSQVLKIEGKIMALEQDRNKIHVIIRGSIQQCNTGEILYKFEQDDTDSALFRTAEIIADKIAVDITNQMTCEAGT
jgi:hypothetical protein